jgi:hypothetical protein
MTIVERSSGFWIVDIFGVVEGPFLDYDEAANWVRHFEASENAYDNRFDCYSNEWEAA